MRDKIFSLFIFCCLSVRDAKQRNFRKNCYGQIWHSILFHLDKSLNWLKSGESSRGNCVEWSIRDGCCGDQEGETSVVSVILLGNIFQNGNFGPKPHIEQKLPRKCAENQ